MYRQNPDYFIPIRTDPELAKMIRHQRYINIITRFRITIIF